MYTTYDKAIAGGIVSLIIAWLAHYGVTLTPLIHNAIASIAFAVVSYAVPHLVVYLTTNKRRLGL